MGTVIDLCVGGITICWSKNHMGIDFGHLFQEGDLLRRKSDTIDYDYYDKNPQYSDEIIAAEEIFSRPLSRIIPRIRLLGSTIDNAREEYETLVGQIIEISSYDDLPDLLSFEEFCQLACRYDIGGLTDVSSFDDKEKAKGRLATDPDFKRLPWNDNADSFWSELSYFGAQMAILSPESMLQVFALNPANSNVEVSWEFGRLVHAGWATRSDFVTGARRKQKILIVTEGASDARIIKRALDVLRPDIADFFIFVDVDERHHFWGTGNLVKFAEGLLRIDILNRVLFVLDNDAEGLEAYTKLKKLGFPMNMRTIVLPNIDEFKNFRTRGPEGVGANDINGLAAAIECYLDLRSDGLKPAQVVWTNYKKEIDAWHGALESKESYAKHFYQKSDDELKNGSYDVSKLEKILDLIILESMHVLSVV